MAKTKLSKKSVNEVAPETEVNTPEVSGTPVQDQPTPDAPTTDTPEIIEPEAPIQDAEAITPEAPVEPKDLAEAQDFAEQKGIDYVGKTYDQLKAELNAGASPAAKAKKLIKVKAVIETPTNIDPAMKAAIDKANADIAIAQAKIAEARELAKKAKDEAKAKSEAEKADRIKKASEAKEAKEAAEKAAAEELATKKAEAEAGLAAAEAVVIEKQSAVDKARQELTDAVAVVNGFKATLGQKVAKAAGTKKSGSSKSADMTKYELGNEYEVSNKGSMVKATLKGIVNGGADRKKFYKFKETESGNIFHIRAYAEDSI